MAVADRDRAFTSQAAQPRRRVAASESAQGFNLYEVASVWFATLRSLCQFAVKRGYLRAGPMANIKPRAIKGDGFPHMDENEIAQFEAHHPISTKPRLALALLLYTAQRRSDAVRMRGGGASATARSQ